MYHPTLLFLNIGTPEMILIMFVALLLFGGEKLPQIAKGLGKGIRDFKDASEDVKRELHNQINNFEEKATEPAVAQIAETPTPIVVNTTPLLDPFAVPVAESHETHLSEVHAEAVPVATEHLLVAPAGESHADVSHLAAAHTEVTHLAENHISLSHVSEETKAEEKNS